MLKWVNVFFLSLFITLCSNNLQAEIISHSNWDSVSNNWACISRGDTFGHQGSYSIDAGSGTPDPQNSLKITYPAGWVGGHDPVHCWNVFPEVQEIWVQYYFKYSPNWQWHAGGNKHFYVTNGPDVTAGNWFIMVRGADQKMGYNTQSWIYDSRLPNTDYNPSIVPGKWHKLKARFVENTPGVKNGILKVWIDDGLVMNYSDMGYRSPSQGGVGIGSVEITPVFGGGEDNIKRAEDYFWVDNFTISTTDPGGVSSSPSQKIPNPPNKLEIR